MNNIIKQTKKPCVAMARVSGKGQEDSGYSLPAQEKLMQEYSDRKELTIKKIFSISESASGKKQREVFEEMMDYTRKHNIKVLVYEKIDRCTRNFRDMIAIEDWLNADEEREIHFVKNSLVLNKNSKSQERLNWSINVVLAKNYIDNLVEEIQKGCKEKAAQGWYPHLPPYGYKSFAPEGSKHKIVIPDLSMAPLIKKMLELYSSGNYSVQRLQKLMYEEGLRSRGGKRVSISRMYEILTSPFYHGEFTWKGKKHIGKHEALIGKETFDKNQDILRGKSSPKYKHRMRTFQGLIKCPHCGGTITWETQKGIEYGHCTAYRHCSKQQWVREDNIEPQIIQQLHALEARDAEVVDWLRASLKQSHGCEIEYHNASIAELEKIIEKAQRRLAAIYEDKIDDKLDLTTYEKLFEKYTKEKDGALEMIRNHSRANTKYYELGTYIYELSQKAVQIYAHSEPAVKRELLNVVFDSLLLDQGKLTATYSEPFELIKNTIASLKGSEIEFKMIFLPEISEPALIGSINEQSGQSLTACPAKWSWRESNPRPE